MYLALLLAITLGAGLLLHGLASLTIFALWRILAARFDAMAPRVAARILFLFRMLPIALSIFALSFFVVPSFLEFEPRTTIEPLSLTLLTLAAVFATVLVASLLRSLSALVQSRRVMQSWMRDAVLQPDALEGVSVYRCKLQTPTIAVMGLWRTHIFASDAVFSALTPEELDAALRHELVHARNFDILRKMFIHVAPTFLPGIDLLKPVTAHWSRMCELAADEESITHHDHSTLNLASALVKVARLSCTSGGDLPTLSAALVRGQESLLGYRVKRLLQISEHPEAVGAPAAFDLRKLVFGAAVLLGLLIAAYPQVLDATHELLEFLVQG